MDKYLFFDLETTGLSLHRSKVVQMSIKVGSWSKTFLINPGQEIEPGATYIHKITNKMVESVPNFKFYSQSIMAVFNNCDYICGYNIRKFDLPILNQELLRCGLELPNKPIIDVYEMVCEFEKTRKLSDVYLRYYGETLKNAHDAEADVMATEKIFNFISSKLI